MIINEQYYEALKDLKYSFLVKLFIKILLVNDSDERPDFIMAKKIFDQFFFTYPEGVSEISDAIQDKINLNTTGLDVILETVNNQISSMYKVASASKRGSNPGSENQFSSEMMRQKPKSFKNLNDSFNGLNTDENEIDQETVPPLRLDSRLSNCTEIDEGIGEKSKVTEFLEKITESNSRLLPASKIINQQNPFKNKAIMCPRHHQPATTACMLLHYGEYFCDRWDHRWGEVEDLQQNQRVKKSVLKEVQNINKDLIKRIESLNKRRMDSEDIDLIFYQIFDSFREIQSEMKMRASLKGSDLDFMNNFIQKVKNEVTNLKTYSNELEAMYKK